ncbi:MAG: DUF4203 domain-containing protein [Bacteroidales bacterium]
MLSTTFHLPAALVLLFGGLLACFAGYRVFRVVLGLYGFILGALFASSLVAPASLNATLVAVLVGGVLGALILSIGYFVGVALVGAGAGAMAAHVVWAQGGWGDPEALPLMVFAIVGSVLAVFFQRYVIIAGTAFGGSWTALVGVLALSGTSAGRQGADPTSVWGVYPFNPTLHGWMTLAWMVVGVGGVVTQLRGKK